MGFVDQIDPEIAAVAGAIPSTSGVLVYGHNADIDTAAAETIARGGGLYPYLAAPAGLEVVSSDINDNLAGTGARLIYVEGLDTGLAKITIPVATLGTTASPVTGGIFYRVLRAYVGNSGSGGINAGTITVRVAGAGATVTTIAASIGTSQDAVYTTAINTSAAITSVFASASGTATGVCSLWVRNLLQSNWQERFAFNFNATTPMLRLPVPITVLQGNDIELRSTVSADNTVVRASMSVVTFTDQVPPLLV